MSAFKTKKRRQAQKTTNTTTPLEQHPAYQNAATAHQQGNSAKTKESLEQLVKAYPKLGKPYYLLASLALEHGSAEDALNYSQKAYELEPGNDRYAERCAELYRELAQYEMALALYERLSKKHPNNAHYWCNLGHTYQVQQNYQAAESNYIKALELNPNMPEARNNLGIILRYLDKNTESVACFKAAIEQNPHFAEAYNNLALTYLWNGNIAQSLNCFDKSASLFHDHKQPVSDQQQLPVHRIIHDKQQMDYLLENNLLEQEFNSYAARLTALVTQCQQHNESGNAVTLRGEDCKLLAPAFNRIIYKAECEPIEGGALNPDLDITAIETEYQSRFPEIIYVDNIFKEETIKRLQQFCNASTIWKENYVHGYLGAVLGKGFANPLLLQITEEIRQKFSKIFGPHKLTQAWAFKYDSTLKGINIHADFAHINLNFWITPDHYNQDKEHGGLVVWDAPAPKDWRFSDYNRNEPKIRQFLKDSGAKPVTIPYRANRCVIFNSTLFHETDQFTFEEGYESRRVNITLLYGNGLRS